MGSKKYDDKGHGHKKWYKKYKVDANKDYFEGNEDATITGNLLANDTHKKGWDLDIKYYTQPKHGTITVDKKTGEFTYTPDPDYHGYDYFKYKVVDKYGKTDWAKVKLHVKDMPEENVAPVAENDCYWVKETNTLYGNVAKNDSDANGDTLTYAIAANTTAPAGLTLNADGTFTYVPEKDDDRDNETVTFQYTVSDGKGGTDTATATIKIKDNYAPPPPNQKPVGGNDKYYVKEKGKLYGDVSKNDTDADGGDLDYVLVDGPDNFKYFKFDEETGKFCYRPEKDKDRKDEKDYFTYQVRDEQGALSDIVKVTICVDDNWGKKKYYDDDHKDKYVKAQWDLA